MRYFVYAFFAFLLLTVACRKQWEDKAGPSDDRLDKPYCNDPEAVNYNWDFPGKPDNSVCYYPTEVFKGSFTFYDTIYYSMDYKFDTVKIYTIKLDAVDRNKLLVYGFCEDQGSSQNFTADRFHKATADSLLLQDSTKMGGQFFCQPKDTLTGYILADKVDKNRLRLLLTVGTDTNVIFHTGSAIRQ